MSGRGDAQASVPSRLSLQSDSLLCVTAIRMRIEEVGGRALLQEIMQLGEPQGTRSNGRGRTSPAELLSASIIGILAYETWRELYAHVRALFA